MLVYVSCVIAYYVAELLSKSICSRRISKIYLCYYIIAVFMMTIGIRIGNNVTHINLNPFITYYKIGKASIQGLKMGGIPEMIYRIGWYGELIIKSELNVILFIPFGLLVPQSNSLWNCRWRVILNGISFSLLIETIQLLFHLGWFDTSDLLHNVIGTVLGFVIYRRILFKDNILTASTFLD